MKLFQNLGLHCLGFVKTWLGGITPSAWEGCACHNQGFEISSSHSSVGAHLAVSGIANKGRLSA
jgi:hypothetical protein